MSKRPVPPVLLLALLLTAGLLAFCLFVALFRQPPPPTEADDDDTGAPTEVAGNAAQGRRFDNAFGSLAALVPQGGAVVVAPTPAAALAGSSADGAGSGMVPGAGLPAGAAPAHGDQFRDLAWVTAQGGAYTLQVLGGHDEASVRQFIASQPNADQYHYVQVMQGGAPWYVVVYGSFASRDQALAVAASLGGLPSRPFVRPFSAYAGAPAVAPAAAPAAASQAASAG